MTDIWELLKKMDCDNCSVHEDCDNDNLCAEWITKAKPQLLKLKEKAENWNRLVGDPEGYIEKCRLNIKKLEAIKSHVSFPNLSTYGLDLRKFTRVYINVKDFHVFIGDLTNILEAEP